MGFGRSPKLAHRRFDCSARVRARTDPKIRNQTSANLPTVQQLLRHLHTCNKVCQVAVFKRRAQEQPTVVRLSHRAGSLVLSERLDGSVRAPKFLWIVRLHSFKYFKLYREIIRMAKMQYVSFVRRADLRTALQRMSALRPKQSF